MEYKEVTDIIAGAHAILDRIQVRVVRSWVSRLYWHSVNVKWYTPPVLLGHSWEIDTAQRGHAVMIRYWWDRSFVLGFWGNRVYDEDEALLNATIHGRERTDGERRGWDNQSFYAGVYDGESGPVLERRPGLRVRATVDAGADGQ